MHVIQIRTKEHTLPSLRLALCLLFTLPAFAQELTPAKVEPHHVKAESVTYLGRPALRVTDIPSSSPSEAEAFAVLPNTSLQDGSIEVDLTGDTAPDAAVNLRGFVGVAFRVSPTRDRFECLYLRPKNGRSNDQLQRNHSTQYISVPGFPWEKLRAETPGQYESYVDLVPGQWTHIRIRISGKTAQLYVNGADQPTLVVNDLKQPPDKGAIALWIGPGTIAHFANLKITP
jgi:hypothetical protein